MPATSGYLGVENQLYRVEVHTGGTVAADHGPTFKWSRENGSVEFRIVRPRRRGRMPGTHHGRQRHRRLPRAATHAPASTSGTGSS